MIEALRKMIRAALTWKCCKCGRTWAWNVDPCKYCKHSYCDQCESD